MGFIFSFMKEHKTKQAKNIPAIQYIIMYIYIIVMTRKERLNCKGMISVSRLVGSDVEGYRPPSL